MFESGIRIIFSKERRWPQKVHGLKPVSPSGPTEEKYSPLAGAECQRSLRRAGRAAESNGDHPGHSRSYLA